MPILKPDEFHGEHHEGIPLLKSLMRCESMEVLNDPRVFADNVLMKRLDAFHVIGICAILMSTLSAGQMVAMETTDFDGIRGGIRYIAFWAMTIGFAANLMSGLIITVQLFHMTRLITAGSTGYELAKSYYLNKNILMLRHMAAKLFFFTTPVFLMSTALTIYVKLGGRFNLKLSAPVSAVMLLSGMFFAFVLHKHVSIFNERYKFAKVHDLPLMHHLRSADSTMANWEPDSIA
jgi:hypothetical protein